MVWRYLLWHNSRLGLGINLDGRGSTILFQIGFFALFYVWKILLNYYNFGMIVGL